MSTGSGTITALAGGSVRAGMANLITRWRRLVDDVGATVWTDAQAQALLDARRTAFYGELLSAVGQAAGGTTEYHLYYSTYRNLEEAGSGTVAWRCYAGTQIFGTADVSPDYVGGLLTFAADQGGSARYLDGRSYDLNLAAADAWRERAAGLHDNYDFSTDGQSFSRQQHYLHCLQMAKMYECAPVAATTVA